MLVFFFCESSLLRNKNHSAHKGACSTRWVLCVARYVFLQRTFSPWGARVGALGGQYGG